MHHYRAILKQVGIVLIGMGILDLMYMVYRVSTTGSNASDRSYSSPGILIVVASIYLIRGSLRTAKIVRWIAAFGIPLAIGTVLMRYFSTPGALLATEFRLNPVGVCRWHLSRIVEIALTCWIYKRLSAAPVVSASLNSGYSVVNPKRPLLFGSAIVIFLVIIHLIVNSTVATKAVELARTQYGAGYNYHLRGISWSNGNVLAYMTAYNEREMKTVQVEWTHGEEKRTP